MNVNLFSPDPSERQERNQSDGSLADFRSLLFPTNRSNLTEILTSGLIGSRAAFSKYYSDLLEIASGRVPMFADSLHTSVLEAVVKESHPGQYPVAIEVDISTLSGPTPEIFHVNAPGSELEADSSKSSFCAPEAIIPRSCMRAIHFASERDLKDFRTHPYSNVRLETPEFRVTPEIFQGDGVPLGQVQAFLEQLPEAKGPDEATFRVEDRVGGAILIAIQFTDAQTEDQSEFLRYSETTHESEDFSEMRSEMPVWLRQPLRPRRLQVASELPEDPDSFLFRSAIRVLIQLDKQKNSYGEAILDSIIDDFRSADLPEEEIESICSQSERLREVLRASRTFEGFKQKGSEVMKALLLVLLKLDLKRFLRWPDDILEGASYPVRATAGLLFGLTEGRKGLPLDLRDPDIDDHLTQAVASTLAHEFEIIGPRQIRKQSESESEVSPLQWLMNADLSSEPAQSIALDLIRGQGLEDSIETILIPPSDEPLEMFYTRSVQDQRRKVVAFRIDGEPTIQSRVKQTEFRKEISSESFSVPEETIKKIKDII